MKNINSSIQNQTLFDINNNISITLNNSSHENALESNTNEVYMIHEILILTSLVLISKISSIHITKRLRVINESLFTVFIGFLGGYFLLLTEKQEYIISITNSYVKVFLIFLLPPIIFESGYNIKIKEFYNNLGTILLYAIIGTCISIIFIGYFIWHFGLEGHYQTFTFQESLAYGALISATDPVCILAAFKDYTTDSNFFLLVFGESILNDAVSMVFYDSVSEYKPSGSNMHKYFIPLIKFFVILLGSCFVGLLLGWVISLILRKISYTIKDSIRIEVFILISCPWMCYLICHLLGLSAIVVIFFIGISFHIYYKPMINHHAQEIVHKFYEEIVSLAESLVFIYIGMAFFADHPYKQLNISLPFFIIILCLVGRFLNVAICSFLANFSRDDKTKISLQKQFFLWFSGVRGAMAFALALKSKFEYPQVGSIFLLLTLIITAFTLIYSSILLEKTLIYCDIIINPVEEEEEQTEYQNKYLSVKNSVLSENLFGKIKTLIYKFHHNYLLRLINNSDKKAPPLKEILMEDFKIKY